MTIRTEGGVVLSGLDRLVAWGRSRSLWPLTYGIACCAIEMMTAGSPRYDLDRFGIIFRATPRQCDVMIVAGPVTKRMEPVIKLLYEQMAEPRWVLAMGSCAISGGAFAGSYNVLPGADTVVPVDIYVPGCPPRPEALMAGLLELRDGIRRGVPPKGGVARVRSGG